MDKNLDCDETINCVFCFQQDNLFSLWHNLKDVNSTIISLKYRTKDAKTPWVFLWNHQGKNLLMHSSSSRVPTTPVMFSFSTILKV